MDQWLLDIRWLPMVTMGWLSCGPLPGRLGTSGPIQWDDSTSGWVQGEIADIGDEFSISWNGQRMGGWSLNHFRRNGYLFSCLLLYIVQVPYKFGSFPYIRVWFQLQHVFEVLFLTFSLDCCDVGSSCCSVRRLWSHFWDRSSKKTSWTLPKNRDLENLWRVKSVEDWSSKMWKTKQNLRLSADNHSCCWLKLCSCREFLVAECVCIEIYEALGSTKIHTNPGCVCRPLVVDDIWCIFFDKGWTHLAEPLPPALPFWPCCAWEQWLIGKMEALFRCLCKMIHTISNFLIDEVGIRDGSFLIGCWMLDASVLFSSGCLLLTNGESLVLSSSHDHKLLTATCCCGRSTLRNPGASEWHFCCSMGQGWHSLQFSVFCAGFVRDKAMDSLGGMSSSWPKCVACNLGLCENWGCPEGLETSYPSHHVHIFWISLDDFCWYLFISESLSWGTCRTFSKMFFCRQSSSKSSSLCLLHLVLWMLVSLHGVYASASEFVKVTDFFKWAWGIA